MHPCNGAGKRSGRKLVHPLSMTPPAKHCAVRQPTWRSQSDIREQEQSNIFSMRSRGTFHFIEMNTRIQVEHTVTEMITGLDLVAEMICIAGGRPLRHKQDDVSTRGHAIEVRPQCRRILHMTSCRTLERFRTIAVPDGPGVRCDHMLYSGYQVPPFYDSLLGKLIVHGETRAHALARLSRALAELRIEGIATTRPLFVDLLREPSIGDNAIHTGWLEEWLAMKRQNNEEASPG